MIDINIVFILIVLFIIGGGLGILIVWVFIILQDMIYEIKNQLNNIKKK